MKHIVITLISSIVAIVLIFVFVISYVRKKTLEQSDRYISAILDDFNREFDEDLMLTESAVYGFLSANFEKGPEGSEFLEVEREDIVYFQTNLQKSMQSLLGTHSRYYDVMFILPPHQSKHHSRKTYWAPLIRQGGDSIVDIAKLYDFENAKNLERCRETKKAFWAIPSNNSRVAKKIINFYVPLCRHRDHKFVGAFVLGLDVGTLDEKLMMNLPYDDGCDMLVAADDGRIIASYPTSYKDMRSIAAYDEKLSKQYFRYERELQRAPWKVITACKKDTVYANAYRIIEVVFITSMLGMFIIIIVCVLVSWQVRRTHVARVAAEQELNMAASVQQKMLQQTEYSTPHASLSAFIRPAREAGGDLYDYAEIDGKLVFCIGDVSGKGMPAALFMTQVVSLFRSALLRTSDPAAIVSSINDVLAESNPDMTFCTLFVAALHGGNLTFCNAGHNPSVLLKDAAECSFVSQKPNVAVGLLKGYPYVSQSLDVRPGDTLLLYTDGISEAMNGKHHQYGDQAILDNLARRTNNQPSHCTQLLVDSVATFVRGAEQSDDITVLAVNVKD